jgi:asparagine synthase (glutamine-hydrolysing)
MDVYRKKREFILKTAMEDRLPKEILKFKKVGLSAPWDYLTKSKDELGLFKSDLFQMPILKI